MVFDVTRDTSSPVSGGEAVDISSANHTATTYSRSIFVGTAGNVKVDMRDGTTLTFTNVQDGTLLPLRLKTVYKVGTTASNMVLVW